MRTHKRKRQRLKKFRLFLVVLCLLALALCALQGGAMLYDYYVNIKDAMANHSDSPSIPNTQTSNEEKQIENENTQETFYGDQEIYDKLRAMIRQDQRIEVILEGYHEYPEALLDMLTRNIEMIDFVLDYPMKKENLYADTISDVKQGVIPFLLQWDEDWGYTTYGDSILAISGCAPTALSMVIAGLTGDASITPYIIAEYADTQGYYVSGTGSSWSLLSEGSYHYGVNATELSLSEANIHNELDNGHPIICSMRPGDFTTTGHFIVLTGIENGKIRVHDPNSRQRSNKLWDYTTLEKQISNLWSYSL